MDIEGLGASIVDALIEKGLLKTAADIYSLSFDDIKSVAYPALRHRLVLSFEALADGVTSDQIIKEILESVKVS